MGNEFYGAIAATFGAAIGAWLLDRWLGVRTRIKQWRAERKEYAEGLRAMVADHPEGRAALAALGDSVGRLTGQIRCLDSRTAGQDKVLATLLAMTLGEFEASTVAKFVCDSEGRNINANGAYCSLLDVDREDLLEFSWRSLVRPEQLEAWVAQFAGAQRDHRKNEGEIEMRHSSGRWIRLRVHMLPFPPDEGPATHWVGILTEVAA